MSSGVSSDGDKLFNELSYGWAAQAKVSVCHVQALPIPPDTVGLPGSVDLYELAEGVFTAREGDKIAIAQFPEGEVSCDKGDLIRLLAIAVFHLATSR